MKQRIIPFFIAFTGFSLPLIFSWQFMDSFYLPKRVFLSMAVCAIGSIWLCLSIKKMSEGSALSIRAAPINKKIFFFLIWCLFTITQSSHIRISMDKFLFLCECVILYFAVLYFIDSQKKFYGLLNALLAAGALVSLIAIFQYYGLDIKDKFTFTAQQQLGNKYGIFSTLGHPNFMAAFLISILPFSFVMLCIQKDSKRALYAACFLLITFAVYISRSKGAWLGCLISFIFLLTGFALIYKDFFSQNRKKSIFISGILIVFVIGIIVFSTSLSNRKTSPFEEVKKTLSIDYSANRARLIIWQTTLMMIKERPLTGVGFGAYSRLYQIYQGKFLKKTKHLDYYLGAYRPGKEAHNDYLHITAETGITGILLFLWLIAGFLRNSSVIVRMSKNAKEKSIILGMTAGIIAVLCHSFVSFPLQQVPPPVVLWMLMGSVMGAPFRNDLEIDRWAVKYNKPVIFFKGKKLRILFQSIIATAAGLFIIVLCRPLYGSAMHIDAYNYMVKNDHRAAVSTLNRALKWYPANADMHLMLGAAYHNLKQYEKAIKEYEISYHLRPDYMILYNSGLIKEILTDEKGAEDYYLKAIELHPDLADAYGRLANIYKRRGEKERYAEYETKWKKYNYRKLR